MTADAITLSIPREESYHGVARLVVGGLAARLDLSYEHLEDLQLALESVLERESSFAGPEVTVRLIVDTGSVGLTIGPLAAAGLRDELAGETEEGVSLQRLLSTLVEDVALEDADGSQWLRLVKRAPITRPGPPAGES